MLASATLTTVLSRKVRNNSVHKEARARGRRRDLTMPAAGGASASVTRLAPTDSGRLWPGLRNSQGCEPAETRDAYLPDAVEIDRGAHPVLQQRRPEQQDLVMHCGLRRRRNRH